MAVVSRAVAAVCIAESWQIRISSYFTTSMARASTRGAAEMRRVSVGCTMGGLGDRYSRVRKSMKDWNTVSRTSESRGERRLLAAKSRERARIYVEIHG